MEPLKKKIITAFVIMLAFGVISSLFLYFIDLDVNKKEKSLQTDFDFHFADFDKNIFEDKEYLELNRDIAYKEGATTILITDGEYEKYGPVVAFFAEYIDSIIRGDHERYNTFFAEEYLDAHGKKDVFTMQQLYNIKLEYLMAREMELDGETYFLLIPATDSEEIDGEVFVMKLVEVDGEEMLEGVDDGELFDNVYNIFKENNKDEFEFLD